MAGRHPCSPGLPSAVYWAFLRLAPYSAKGEGLLTTSRIDRVGSQ